MWENAHIFLNPEQLPHFFFMGGVGIAMAFASIVGYMSARSAAASQRDATNANIAAQERANALQVEATNASNKQTMTTNYLQALMERAAGKNKTAVDLLGLQAQYGTFGKHSPNLEETSIEDLMAEANAYTDQYFNPLEYDPSAGTDPNTLATNVSYQAVNRRPVSYRNVND